MVVQTRLVGVGKMDFGGGTDSSVAESVVEQEGKRSSHRGLLEFGLSIWRG